MRLRSGGAGAAAAYLLLALVMTWPLARGLTRDLPADFGDPLLNTWILAWDASHFQRALGGHPAALAEYWNANIYYPHPLALAYSEHLTTQAVMVLPIYLATGNAILCYNVLFLATFVLSALGTFLLVRELTRSSAAAFVSGVAFGFAPYRFGTLPHVQVLSSMWMPFVLLGVHRFFVTRRLPPLAAAAVAWIAQNLSCGYYLLFFSPLAALYIAIEITGRRLWRDRRVLLPLAGALAVVAMATLPFLIPYLRLRQLGFSARSLTETIRYSADVYAYLTADVALRVWGGIMRVYPKPEGSLFPGFTISLLALAGIIVQWGAAHRSAAAEPRRKIATLLTALLALACGVTLLIFAGYPLRFTVAGVDFRFTSLYRGVFFATALGAARLAASARARTVARALGESPAAGLALVTILAVLMSLGPRIEARGRVVEDQTLYGLFYGIVPGFDGLRVPARFAMIASFGLAALAGYGAAWIARARYGAVFAALAAVAIAAESWAAPIALNVNSTDYRQPGLMPLPDALPPIAEFPAVYRFAVSLPPASAIVELPFGEVAFETRYMYFSTLHWRPLVNGYSGGAPVDYGLWVERFKEILQSPESAWAAVRDTRATHLIVHEGSYAGDRGPRISAWARDHGAREVAAFDRDRVFVIGN